MDGCLRTNVWGCVIEGLVDGWMEWFVIIN